ncbi:MAG: MlaC/ttg2D family ABC transporter substrate-binding protein [Myxococcales bacterium]
MLGTLILALAAAVPAQSATQVLQLRDAQIRKSIAAEGARSRKGLEAAVMRLVDTEAMAKAALGKSWDAQPKREQRRFLEAFDARLRQAITQEIDFFNSSKIDYRPEQPDGDATVVPTEMAAKGDTTEVDYRLRKGPAGWRIVDIVVDGVSTTQNYRSSFGKVIAKEGWNGLIVRLEKKQPSPEAAK